MSVSWEDICRLCASHSELNQSSQELSQIILKHLSIMIKTEDDLSTKVCNKCEEKVTDFHNFYMECERIQSMFIDFKNENTLSDSDFDFECSDDVKVKEELNYNETDNESYENSNRISKAIMVNKTKKVHKMNKRKSSCIKKVHRNILKYDCHICKLECSNWKVLSSHIKKEHKTKAQVKCLCGKILYCTSIVLDHEIKHNPARCFSCSSCSLTFSSKKRLIIHESTHLPKKEKSYVCDECLKKYTNSNCLKNHKHRYHNIHYENSWPCKLCDKKLASKSGLISHVKIVHEKLKPFMCDLCGHSTSSKADLTEHQSVHSSEKNFACDKCDKKYKTKRALLNHIDSHADTAYQCPHCPMLLNSRSTLRSHLYVHSDTRNFTCSVCDKGFKSKKYLAHHKKIHTGERPYKCSWCSLSFSIKRHYKLHAMKHHPLEFQNEIRNVPQAPVSDGKNNVPKKVIHVTIKSSINLNNITKIDNNIRKKTKILKR